MAITFPSLINFIDEYGMEKFHEMHECHQALCSREISFENFVNELYQRKEREWGQNMFFPDSTFCLSDNEEEDVVLTAAKIVFMEIFEHGNSNMKPATVIIEQEIAPDYGSASLVVHKYHGVLFPAIQKFLNEFKG
jgi:hypothetical protein